MEEKNRYSNSYKVLRTVMLSREQEERATAQELVLYEKLEREDILKLMEISGQNTMNELVRKQNGLLFENKSLLLEIVKDMKRIRGAMEKE